MTITEAENILILHAIEGPPSEYNKAERRLDLLTIGRSYGLNKLKI